MMNAFSAFKGMRWFVRNVGIHIFKSKFSRNAKRTLNPLREMISNVRVQKRTLERQTVGITLNFPCGGRDKCRVLIIHYARDDDTA